jgi:hypothetical protein
MWGAILITLVAAAGNNIGKALQKSATRSLPQINLARPEVGSGQRRGAGTTQPPTAPWQPTCDAHTL